METVAQHFQYTGEHVSGFVKYISSLSNNGKKYQSLMESTLNTSLVNSPYTLERINIDPRDFNTPDNWIPRYRELIRLMEKHLFNSEPSLSMLMQSFITPTLLHYVRNHESVPKLYWDIYCLVVDG
ncbi:13593_t:CDS:1 [Acaulospora morrowiae]|uniref:13593_t:CDS:1 n=1 Tax=Acaulospora morrowiae TaxID=94023 RepID=A0A9N9BW50_9GLOM|nr:13593_t:CDS:1 [Acaulospora morrowiae]